MPRTCRISILSDVHYAGDEEQARGEDYEFHGLSNPLIRVLLRAYRHRVWLRHPFRQNYLLNDFTRQAPESDLVIANGDYSCDSAFVGLSDGAAFQSAQLCLSQLRERYGGRLHAVPGDHEFGKVSLTGNRGGLRLASWTRLTELEIRPAWKLEVGRYTLIGVTSTLLGLPVFARDALPGELPAWHEIRRLHLREVESIFAGIPSGNRVLLFCHDPTALPWLAQLESVQARLGQIEQTIIGHLHSEFILRQSSLLSGMPRLSFMGPTVHRLSSALRQARAWKPFRVRLCPSLAGMELFQDGGFLTCEIREDASHPIAWQRHRLPRRKTPGGSAEAEN